MNATVDQALLIGGVLDNSYFNGRVLTAEDMRADQQARRQIDARLGRAIGSGVVHGLDVSIARGDGSSPRSGSDGRPAALTITPGLAIAPGGRTLELTEATDLTLVTPRFVSAGSGFGPCAPDSILASPTGVGLYLLTVGHAIGYRERAPLVGFGAGGTIDGCGSRYEVQGIEFRLLKISLRELGLSPGDRDEITTLVSETCSTLVSDVIKLSRLRNRAAHAFFGTARIRAESTGLFPSDGSSAAPDGLTSLLEKGRISNEEVPIALLYWTRSGIAFLDNWSVRRRPESSPEATGWQRLLSPRRTATAEAVLNQFQAQFEDLIRTASPVAPIEAKLYFRYLPPAGLLPAPPKADGKRFLGSFAPEQAIWTESNLLRALLNDSFNHEPVDLQNERANAFRLYQVGDGGGVMAFASQTLPRIYGIGTYTEADGDPPLGRWDWNRFARAQAREE